MDVERLPTAQDVARALTVRDRSIGALMVDSGMLTAAAADTVLRHARAHGVRFGDAAVQLGFVTAADVQHALARQFEYPYLAPHSESVAKEVVAAFAPFSASVEALRALRTQLMLRWFDVAQPNKALAIVSVDRRDGRSHLAANLAVVFSQLGERTLLIDADLRHPRQHEVFRLKDALGLSALLSGRADANVLCRIEGLTSLSVLPAGSVPPNPQELLARPAFAMLLQELGLQFDVIVVDTAPSASGADFQSVVAATRGAVLLTRQDVTRTTDAVAVSAAVGAAGAKLVGTVLSEH